ncbi:MAG: hypothetical protein IJ089_05780 [Clostridia bacterium]|nr:hypothetical protein [Clostridia bacterium]
MAAKKTPVDQLNKAVMDMLKEYEGELGDNLSKITEELGKKGRQALRRESRRALKTHTGDYAKGWQVKIVKGRLKTTATLYNDHYSLPHLLEYSHEVKNRKGGPVLGETKPHPLIEQVERELVDTFEREVMRKL